MKEQPRPEQVFKRLNSFSPASRIILIERTSINSYGLNPICFSPASRIILIERYQNIEHDFQHREMFQSRKQDYFN